LMTMSDSGKVRLFATGLGGLGLLGWRRKRKEGASTLGFPNQFAVHAD
jgi:MYXO-CTERM domain-containing protein